MNRLLVQLVLSALCGAAGYFLYPYLHDAPRDAVSSSAMSGTTKSQVVAACDLGPEQIDHLASRIAPKVVERLATSGLNGVSPDPKVAAAQRDAQDKEKANQDAAFNKATQMVDQLIASRRVTPEGMSEAARLLQETGQSERAYLLHARIAAAINRGELTPEQAGMVMPR